MSKKNWRSGFLSSSYPLEFDIAKILVKNNVSVEPDYCYERVDAGQAKDFSVDLSGSLYFPTSNPNKVQASLNILVECKYRTPNMIWVFLPDVNRLELSIGLFSRTVRVIDEFSYCRVAKQPIYSFEYDLSSCYKGTEIDISKGEVHDSELRHGISQLQYALPRFITDEILLQVSSNEEDITPFFVLPILITTAELHVLKKGSSLKLIESTDNLDELTEKVPYLTLISSLSPSFLENAKREFERLRVVASYATVSNIEKRIRASGTSVSRRNLPSTICKSLSTGNICEIRDYCSQFVVCSSDAFQSMLDRLKETIRAGLRKKKSVF